MFQLMDITLNICRSLLLFHKALFLDHCYFLFTSNDLNTAVKHCKVHHSADDSDLLHINDSIKKFKKVVNSELKM